MVRRASWIVLALVAFAFVPTTLAGGPDFYGVTIEYTSPFSGAWSASPELNCIQGAVPAPEIEVRCNSTTFGASFCKSPAASGDVLGFNANLIVRSICGAGAQADCVASTSGLTLADSCSDEEATLGSGLPLVCHVVPSGAIIHYTAECKAYIG